MLVLALKDGESIDIAGIVQIRITFDRRRTNLVRLSIDGDAAPIKRIAHPRASDGPSGKDQERLVEKGQSLYKPTL